MADLESDENIVKMTADLTKIKEVYETDLAEVSTAISENTGDLVLTKDMLTNLTAAVESIRNGYTM
jgi:hypothetical protein